MELIVALALMILFMGLGIIVLAWFGLAPMPEWMKKYKSKK